VRSLLFEEGYRGDVCFLPDGGSDWKMERSAKGILRVSVRARGKSAHGARPWLGRDANAELARYIATLSERFGKLNKKNPLHPEPTLTVGTLHGGRAFNQVPESAEAELDIRFPITFSRDRVMQLLEDAKPSGSHLAIRVLSHSSGYRNDTESPCHRLYAEVLREVRGRKPGLVDAHGSSDARHFINAGIPTILIRPRGGGQHSESEWIDLPDLETYYHALRSFAQRVAKR
jgi:succinyl-diaminopimelate desuccinylase